MLGPQTPDKLPDQTGQVSWPGAWLASQGISFNKVVTGPGRATILATGHIDDQWLLISRMIIDY